MDEIDAFIEDSIERWRDEFHFIALWDRQPEQVQTIKWDGCDDPDILRERRAHRDHIRRELEFIAYDCS